MFAVLHLASFPLQAVLRHEPDVAGQPAALFDNARRKSVVLAVNATAAVSGVEIGMTAPQAVARCAKLLIRTPQAALEAEARAALLAVGFTLSPLIEDTAPGVCTADLRGSPPEKHRLLVTAALAQLHALGFTATAGIAPTPLLALYAARAVSADSESKRNENEKRFEHSVRFVTHPSSFLAPLPLATADPSPRLAAVLAGWGLRTLGDVTALSCEAFVRRFGAEGLAFWKRAAGGELRPLHPAALPQHFAAEMKFEQEIESLEPLLFVLQRFLDRLSLELQAAQFVAAEIDLTLRLENDHHYARRFRLPEPTARTEILFRALHTHLESVRTDATIVAIRLELIPTRPAVRQQGIFDSGLRDPHGFAETLARAAALVGSDRIGTPQLEDTHRPDAVKLVAPPATVASAVTTPVHAPLAPPLHRFRPRLPARLEIADGRLTYLWTDTVRGEIADRSTAYPQNGDWWEPGRAWSREEIDVELAHGGIYLLVREGNHWFLEGEYD